MSNASKNAIANVLGVSVDAIDMDRAVSCVRTLLRSRQKGYICAAGVHGVMEAQRSRDLARAYADSALIIPDGMPLVWVGRAQGHRTMKRVTGPDFMIEIFRRKEFRGLTHFLYGGEPGVAEKLRSVLRQRFPAARIVGADTPPFRPLSSQELEELVARIRAMRPDIIWVGIGCPRQELFMQQSLPLFSTQIMVGVGAAFDYHTGRIRDSSEWVKKAGLQWLHRLIQDPRRLWRRYLRNNPAFVYRIVCQLMFERLSPVAAPVPQLQSPSKVEDESVRTSAVA